ncbi:MAG: MarR family transcriptional regulator [Fluviicola sp. XM-24bin1]|nr:MAG: MarR family transcriptional regulator [Fluviicola sp. XM-24bin1]
MEYTDVLINIRKIIRSINLESKRIQKEYGISIPQYLCLNFLNNTDEYRATAKEIGMHLNLNASTVSGIISRLEKKGYLAKLPNQSDKRSTYIYLTAIGEKMVTSMPDLLHEKLSKKLKSLSEEDLENLQGAMDLLVSLMGVEDVDASPLITPGENIIQQ